MCDQLSPNPNFPRTVLCKGCIIEILTLLSIFKFVGIEKVCGIEKIGGRPPSLFSNFRFVGIENIGGTTLLSFPDGISSATELKALRPILGMALFDVWSCMVPDEPSTATRGEDLAR